MSRIAFGGEVDAGQVADVVLVQDGIAYGGDVAAVGHLEPDEQAAMRRAPLGAVAEVLAERGEHRVALGALDAVYLLYVGVEMPRRVAMHRVRRERVDRTAALDGDGAIQHFRRPRSVADSHAGRDYLGERRHVHHAAGLVERVQRRGRLRPVEAQVDVAVVFQYRDAAAVGDLDHRLAALERHRPPLRVLVRGDGVDELGLASLRGRALDGGFKRVGEHAVLVALDAANVRAEPAELRERAGVDVILRERHVAGVDQRL